MNFIVLGTVEHRVSLLITSWTRGYNIALFRLFIKKKRCSNENNNHSAFH